MITQNNLEMAGYELDGVIADVELFDGFDDVCLNTIKRVRKTIADYVAQPQPRLFLDLSNSNGNHPVQPAQDHMAWEHFDKAYNKACNSSKPQDWMDAALMAQQVRNTHPAPSWQGLTKIEIMELFKVYPSDPGFHMLCDQVKLIDDKLKEKNT